MSNEHAQLSQLIAFHTVTQYYEDGQCRCGTWVDRGKDHEHVAHKILEAGWTLPQEDTQ